MKNQLLLTLMLTVFVNKVNGGAPISGQIQTLKKEEVTAPIIEKKEVAKIAYVDVDLVMANLDAIKKVDVELQSYKKQLRAQLDTKVQAFEADCKKFQEEHKALSETQKNEKTMALSKRQAELEQMDQQARQQLAEKQLELTAPILEKFNTVIQKIAEEKGFTLVFNKTLNGAPLLLYGKKEYDITTLVAESLKKEIAPVEIPVAVKKEEVAKPAASEIKKQVLLKKKDRK